MITAPLLLVAVVGLMVVIGAVFILGGSTALPGVSAAGVKLSGLSAPAAAAKLQSGWTLTLSDGTRSIPVDPASLGITLDAQATAQQAVTYGRGHGDLLRALVGNVDLPPVIQINLNQTLAGLLAMRDQIEQAPYNAGIRWSTGRLNHALPSQARRSIWRRRLRRCARMRLLPSPMVCSNSS